MKHSKLPSQTELLALLDYNPDTGVLVWKARPEVDGHVRYWNRKCAGKLATRARVKDNYHCLCLAKKYYNAHRIIWMMYHGQDPGDLEIDHINGDASDNRITNLRLATRSGNRCNTRKQKNPATSKYKGVWCNRRLNRWVASIKFNGVGYYLGSFDTEEEAHAAHSEAAHRLHGEFARTQ